jgi:hypothetical protein
MRRGRRVELDEVLEVELHVVQGDAAVVVVDRAGLGGGVLGVKPGCRSADEARRFAQRHRPQRRIQRSVIDVANERRDDSRLIHGALDLH